MNLCFDNYTIRPIRLSDTEAYFELVNSNLSRISDYFPGIIKFTGDIETTRDHIKDRIAGEEKGNYMIYLLVENESDKLIGVIQLKDIDQNAGKREMGMFIDKDFTNKGLMTKCVSMAADYCFNELDLNKVFLRIAMDNVASRRVAEKSGFEVEGILRHDFKTSAGKLIDAVYYGKLKSDNSGK